MYSPLLALLSILVAAPTPASGTPDAATAPGAPSAAPDPTAPSGAGVTPAAVPDLRLPSAGVGAGSLVLPAVALAALAGAALVLRRKRLSPRRRVQVLETTSLGPKRGLVLARLGDELLLLGSSEAGIQLLRTHPVGPEEPATGPAPAPAPARARARPAPETPAALSGLVARLRRTRPAGATPAGFDALLAESDEDRELRMKLASGQRGNVP